MIGLPGARGVSGWRHDLRRTSVVKRLGERYQGHWVRSPGRGRRSASRTTSHNHHHPPAAMSAMTMSAMTRMGIAHAGGGRAPVPPSLTGAPWEASCRLTCER